MTKNRRKNRGKTQRQIQRKSSKKKLVSGEKKINEFEFSFNLTDKDIDDAVLGRHLPYAKKIIIYLPHCVTPDYLLTTIEHEILHHVLFPMDLDVEEEHAIIDLRFWIEFMY